MMVWAGEPEDDADPDSEHHVLEPAAQGRRC